MSKYFFVFLHTTAALWLASGVFSSAVLRAQVRRSESSPARALGWRSLWRLHAVYTLPGILLVGLLGIHLVGVDELGFGRAWIRWSLLLWVIMLVVSLFYLTPRLRRTAAAARTVQEGGDSTELDRLTAAKLPGIVSDVIALLILVILVLMAFKPA
jgi:uncharacterized membrane protein